MDLGNCDLPCTGNTSETCGGEDFLNLFYSGGVEPGIVQNVGTTGWTYEGCYTYGLSLVSLRISHPTISCFTATMLPTVPLHSLWASMVVSLPNRAQVLAKRRVTSSELGWKTVESVVSPFIELLWWI